MTPLECLVWGFAPAGGFILVLGVLEGIARLFGKITDQEEAQ